MTGYIIAEESGPFELGISLVGRARLFVDGKLVVDNGIETKQTPGPSFYGMLDLRYRRIYILCFCFLTPVNFSCDIGLGTIEEVGEVSFVKGKKYEIRVEYTNVPVPVSFPTCSNLYSLRF